MEDYGRVMVMEDGKNILLYISLQAREATYSCCSRSPVTRMC